MSEIERSNPISVDPTETSRPATEPTTGMKRANGQLDEKNGRGHVERDEDIRGKAGVAAIKAEFLLAPSAITQNAQSQAEIDDDEAEGRDDNDRSSKRQKTGKGQDRKKNRGQNKNRPVPISREPGPKICRAWEQGLCERGEKCNFQHSWDQYFEHKPKDLLWPVSYTTEEPYTVLPESRVGDEGTAIGRSLDRATICTVQQDLGWCPYGWRCRYAGAHVQEVDEVDESLGDQMKVGKWELTTDVVEKGQGDKKGWKMKETNWPDNGILHRLRGDKYDFEFSRRYLALVEPEKPFTLSRHVKEPILDEEEAKKQDKMQQETHANGSGDGAEGKGHVDGQSEALDVPLRPEEKRRLTWGDELYLAPLTTVGNLPFRRLCTTLGATITCSEMALAQPLISGLNEEWALCRRHADEKTFGIQLAGGYPNRMVPAAEVIAKELGANDGSGNGVDFVDVNMGCPIDLVFNQGAGSALMDTPGRLGKILVGMNRALGEIPLTVKFRMGVATNKPNAHKLMPRFAREWGASSLTLHGRSRQQRYSKLANWDYIKQCVDTLRATEEEENLPRTSMFGNGDCYSAQAYYDAKEASGVDGVLIARGALIKPWLFTEIKERREWDISATERLEIVKKFAEFGLSHWGSDHVGVQTTRRFLCEYLSFTHRYIPLGLLERLPAQMNERPPPFKGRSELETLLASPDSRDWVKISEMFLGKVPEGGWNWVPKHKSNAYGGEEAQG